MSKVKTRIWYYLSNNGDGTGTPHFCDSEKLAKLMEDLEFIDRGEGWGDTCVDFVDLVSEGHVHVEDILTPKYALEEIYANLECNGEPLMEQPYMVNDRYHMVYDTYNWEQFWTEYLPLLREIEELGPSKFD